MKQRPGRRRRCRHPPLALLRSLFARAVGGPVERLSSQRPNRCMIGQYTIVASADQPRAGQQHEERGESMTAHTNPAGRWVQPILFARHGTHEATALLGAQASASVYLAPDASWRTGTMPTTAPSPVSGSGASALLESGPLSGSLSVFDQWLAQEELAQPDDPDRMAVETTVNMTVLRATYIQMTQVTRWADRAGVSWASFTAGDSAAVALRPILSDDLPKCLTRLRASETHLPRAELPRLDGAPGDPWLRLNAKLSTDQAITQAARALWSWVLHRRAHVGRDGLAVWYDDGCPAHFTFDTADRLRTP